MSLIPKKSRLSLFRKNQRFYANIEDIFHARIVETPSQVHPDFQVWKYFVIYTKVNVSDYGKNIIKNVHIEFEIARSAKGVHPIVIHDVLPTKNSRVIGVRKGTEEISDKYKVRGDLSAGTNIANPFNFGDVAARAELGISKINASEEFGVYEYPFEVRINTFGSAGSRATWDFSQGRAVGWDGEYRLEIHFKLDLKYPLKRNGQYHMNWRIKINDIDLFDDENGNRRPREIEFIHVSNESF